MKIRSYNLGDLRWKIQIDHDPHDQYNKLYEVKKWIKETYPDIFCRGRSTLSGWSSLEVRGSDQGIKMHIIMRWS